jgi:hypothetical protein
MDASFDTSAHGLGLALQRLLQRRAACEPAHDDDNDQDQEPQHPGGPDQGRSGTSKSSSSSSSSEDGWTEPLLDILTASITSSRFAVAPITVYLMSSSSGREGLLARPQLLADLIAAACTQVEFPSGTAIREAVVALVQQAASRLVQMPEVCTALQQQLPGGSRVAGELLGALTSTPAGRQVVVGQPDILTAAAEGASAFLGNYTRPPPPVPRCQPAYLWGAALVALLTSDDSRAVVLTQQPQLVVTIQALLLLQLPAYHTPQQEQQQAWALVLQALGCPEVLQAWGSSTLPRQLHGGSLMTGVAFTTSRRGWAAAGAALRVLLSGLPPASLVRVFIFDVAAPDRLLQLQGRLEALGDTSLLEGVAGLLQRLDPPAVTAAAVTHDSWRQLFQAACQVQPDLVAGLLQRMQEEDLPAAAAAFPTWQGLFEAAAQLQPGVASIVESLRSASSSIAALLAGVRLGHQACVQRLAAMLSEGTDSPSRQQVIGCTELPGALADAIGSAPAQLTPQLKRLLVSGLVQGPVGRELLLSSPELQEAVAADVRHFPGEFSVFIRFGMNVDIQTRDAEWAKALEVRRSVLHCCMLWVHSATTTEYTGRVCAQACAVVAATCAWTMLPCCQIAVVVKIELAYGRSIPSNF